MFRDAVHKYGDYIRYHWNTSTETHLSNANRHENPEIFEPRINITKRKPTTNRIIQERIV